MSTIPERNLQAETRAVEEGHRAYLAGSAISVKSDSVDDLHYRVTAAADGAGSVIFRCEPDRAVDGVHGYVVGATAGHTPCKHAALAARRLERAGVLRWDAGIWVLTDAEQARLVELYRRPADIFKGLS